MSKIEKKGDAQAHLLHQYPLKNCHTITRTFPVPSANTSLPETACADEGILTDFPDASKPAGSPGTRP